MSAEIKLKYLFIDLDTVSKEDDSFLFDLYLFQPINGTFTLVHEAHTPLTLEKIDSFEKIINSGGKLAIASTSVREYLHHTGLKIEDIPGLDFEKHPLFLEWSNHQQIYQEELAKKYNYLEGIRTIIRREDFSEIIRRTKAEISQFKFTESPTISFAHRLATEYLNDQKFMNKVVALVYMIARQLGIEDHEELAHLIVATFYRDLGISQISYEQFAKQNPNDNLDKGYQKHPALALFLLSKSNLELSPKTMKLILDHHELFNGSGYPNGKKDQQIELPSQIIGLADHIISFATGLLTSNKTPYLAVFKAIAKEHKIKGLQFGYHPTLKELMEKIVSVF